MKLADNLGKVLFLYYSFDTRRGAIKIIVWHLIKRRTEEMEDRRNRLRDKLLKKESQKRKRLNMKILRKIERVREVKRWSCR